MRSKLLYQRAPFWGVGEDRPAGADRRSVAEAHAALRAGDHYPGDHAGRVISCIPASCEYSPADTADPHRRVVDLDLTDEELVAVKSRRLKVGVFGLEPVTFDDRWGAVAAKLREKHEDPELFERDEAAALEAAEAANTAERQRYDLEQLAFEIARRDYVRELVAFNLLAPALGLDAPVAPQPPAPPAFTECENAFEREAGALASGLPPTVTHSGAGLYKVQAAGTMATPAHLWAMEAVDPPDDGDPGGNPGTGSNVTVVPGIIGQALEFGLNSNVNVGDVAELNAVQKFTIAFRMNQDVLDQIAYIFEKRIDDTHMIRILTANNGFFLVNCPDGVVNYGRFDYSAAISAGAWHHVTVVFDGTQSGNANRLKVYVDGSLVTLAFLGTIPAAMTDLSEIDAMISVASIPFDGKLDDFRIYADALTDAQVKDVAGRGITHWDTIEAFDENLLEYSEQFQQAGSWVPIGTPVVTPDTDVAPDGEQTADRVEDDDPTAIEGLSQSVAVPNDANWVYAFVHAKKVSSLSPFPEFRLRLTGGAEQNVMAQLNTLTGATVTRASIGTVSVAVTELDDYWRMELGVTNNTSGNTAAELESYPTISTTWGVVEVGAVGFAVLWGAQVTLMAQREYMPTLLRDGTYTNIRLTTGGLTDGERDGEVFVSGGNSYAVIRAGVDFVRIVGDASGESGACTISPYMTIQSAHDQLWADQGAAAFTATQEIRVYDGTYNEMVTVPAFVPTPRWRLLIKAAAGNSPTWSCAGVDHAIYSTVAVHYIDIDGFTISGQSTANYALHIHSSSTNVWYRNCHITCISTSSIQFQTSSYSALFENCELDGSVESVAQLYPSNQHHLHRLLECEVHDYTKLVNGSPINLGRIEGCTIWNITDVFNFYPAGTKKAAAFTFLNNTVYNCTNFVVSNTVAHSPVRSWIVMRNNIFHTISRLWWDQDAGDKFDGGPTNIKGNSYYNVTTWFDSVDEANITDFATWQARGYDADGIEADPLLTTPATGDMSLAAASPCRNTGLGSGVVDGVNAVAFDAHHPDIGAWSSGDLTVAAPAITSIADDGTTTSVTLSLGADNAQDVLSVYYAKTGDATWALFGSTRTGPGTLQITGLVVGWYDFCCVAARGGEVSLPSRSVRFAVMATALASPGAALNALLRADSTLAALVGDHIYPQAAPERAKVPYVVSTRVGGVPAHTIAAAAGFVEARFQIDSYGATLEDAQTIADAVRNILDGYRGTVTAGSAALVVGSIRRDSDIDGFTEPAFAGGVGRHLVIQDYLMTHQESVPAFP